VDSVCLSFRTYVDLSRPPLYLTWKCGLQSTSDVSRARWFAPERITITSVTPPTKEVDIWSFGLLCLEVFAGEDPYRSYSDFYVLVLLKEGTTPEHPGSTAVGLTSRMWQLMQSCWQINPAERPLMSEIQSTVCSMLPRRPRQPSSGNKDLFDSTFPIIDTSNAETYQGSSSSAVLGMLNDSLPSVTHPLPSETFDHKADTRAPVSPGPELRVANVSIAPPWFTETTSQAATSTTLEGSEDSNTYSRVPGLKLRGKQSNYQRNRQDEPSARQTDYNLSNPDDDVDADNDEEKDNFSEFFDVDTGSYNGPYSMKTMSKQSFSAWSMFSTDSSRASRISG